MTDILLSSANTANHYNELINELTSPINSSFEDTTTTAYPAAYSNTFQAIGFMPGYQYYEQQQQRPRSPESISSLSSSPTTPPIVSNQVVLANRVMDTEIMTPVVSSTTDRVKEMITRANSVPMEFYHTEFLEYSKETYEKKTRSKRKRSPTSNTTASTTQYSYPNKRNKVDSLSDQDFEEDDYQDTMLDTMSSAEIRRQIHIQSEQKRRAQIKDGFDELRKHLPGCNNKKMSKASLLSRTVQQLQHLKGVQSELLSEVERLLQENESLKKFQQNLIQRQAMEKMYTF